MRPEWLLVLMLAGCQPVRSLDVQAVNDTDHVQWAGSPSAPVLQVVSPEGIGGVILTKAENATWPDDLKVELRLSALEGFVLRTAAEQYRLEVTAEGDVLMEPAHPRVLHMNSFEAIKDGKKFNLSIRLGSLAEPGREIRLEWVDFYR